MHHFDTRALMRKHKRTCNASSNLKITTLQSGNNVAPTEAIVGCSQDGSAVVQTSWALLGLMAAGCTDIMALRRGVDFLRARQLPSGGKKRSSAGSLNFIDPLAADDVADYRRCCADWPQEGITGVFNRACGITYTAYRNVFPIWALGRYGRLYEQTQ